MKTILNLSVALILSIASFLPANSQTNTCFTANPFCSSNLYNFPNTTSGTAPSGPSYGCLTTRPRPIWYYMEIDMSGTIDILLQQTTGPNGGGSQIDVDFAMWGPFSSLNAGCNAIMAGGLPPIQCSYSSSYSEDIGIGVSGGTGSGASTPPPAVAGQFYIVLLTNYNGSSGYISFNQTGGTGSADCSIVEPCSISNFVANVTSCAPMTANYSVNGTINVTNPPSTGQLIVRDCNGNQTIVASAPFNASSYPYNLTGLVANGTGCSVEAYFSNDATCSALLTYTAPLCNGCSMSDITANVGLCQTNGTYGVSGAVSFSNPPATGTMTVSTSCGGTQTFNAPFVSPINYSIAGLPANGNPCNVSASFSAITNCQTTTPITAPTFLTPIFDTISVCIGAAPPALPAMSAEAIPGTWSPATINTSTAGTSNYTFTPNSNECAGLGTLVVVVNPLPDVQVPPTQTLYPCQASPTVSFTGSSTAPGAGYQWTGPGIVSGANAATVVVNATGNYGLTVTNPSTGCSNSNSVTVISDVTVPAVSIDPAIAISCDNPTITLSANSPTPGATFVWGANPGIISGGTTLTPTVNQAGSYQITVTGPNSCTNSATIVVTGDTQLPNVNTSPSSFVITCDDPTVSINGSSTTPGVSYVWTGPSIQSGQGTGTIVADQAGSYGVTVTNPANNCVNTASFTVTQDALLPDVSIAVPSALDCNNSTVQLQGSSTSAGVTMSWTGPGIVSGGSTANAVVNAPGNYILTVTNPVSGCWSSDSVTVISDLTVPVVSIDPPIAISCDNPTITITANSPTPGATFVWGANPGIISGSTTLTPTVNQAGSYQITVTGTNGCVNSATVTVTGDTQVPNVNTSPASFVISCTTPTVSINGSSTTPGVSYSWTGPSIQSGQGTGTIVVNQAGSYVVTVTNPVNNCINTATFTVTGDTQLPNVSIATPSSLDCNNSTVQLQGSSSTAGVTPSWTGPGIVSGGNTLTPTVNSAGTYTLTVTNPVNSCTNSASVTVNFIPFVTPDIFSDTTICGNTFQIPASSIVANGNITWVESIGNNGTFSNPNVTAPLFTAENGVVNYTLTFTDACGLSAAANVTLIPRPQITAPSVSCDLAEYGINVQSYDGGVWTVVENPNTPYVEDTTLTFEYGDTLTGGAGQTGVTVSHHGTYTLYFNNNDLCPDTSITLNFPPYLWTQVNDTTLCIGEEYQLNAWQTSYVADYLWNTGATGTSIIVNQPGEYIVTVSNICHSYSDTAYIQFETCDIEAPNVISLSSKDGNNLWFVNSHGIAEFECIIVNRWGNLIYEYNDINGSWNGRDLGGHLVSEGVYFYTIKAKMAGGEEIKKHGFIHVVY